MENNREERGDIRHSRIGIDDVEGDVLRIMVLERMTQLHLPIKVKKLNDQIRENAGGRAVIRDWVHSFEKKMDDFRTELDNFDVRKDDFGNAVKVFRVNAGASVEGLGEKVSGWGGQIEKWQKQVSDWYLSTNDWRSEIEKWNGEMLDWFEDSVQGKLPQEPISRALMRLGKAEMRLEAEKRSGFQEMGRDVERGEGKLNNEISKLEEENAKFDNVEREFSEVLAPLLLNQEEELIELRKPFEAKAKDRAVISGLINGLATASENFNKNVNGFNTEINGFRLKLTDFEEKIRELSIKLDENAEEEWGKIERWDGKRDVWGEKLHEWEAEIERWDAKMGEWDEKLHEWNKTLDEWGEMDQAPLVEESLFGKVARLDREKIKLKTFDQDLQEMGNWVERVEEEQSNEIKKLDQNKYEPEQEKKELERELKKFLDMPGKDMQRKFERRKSF